VTTVVKVESDYTSKSIICLILAFYAMSSQYTMAEPTFELRIGKCKLSIPGTVLGINISSSETILLVEADRIYNLKLSDLHVDGTLDDGATLISSGKIGGLSVHHIRAPMKALLEGRSEADFALLEANGRSLLISGSIAEKYWDVPNLSKYTLVTCTD